MMFNLSTNPSWLEERKVVAISVMKMKILPKSRLPGLRVLISEKI
jgi:hypothetical protein